MIFFLFRRHRFKQMVIGSGLKLCIVGLQLVWVHSNHLGRGEAQLELPDIQNSLTLQFVLNDSIYLLYKDPTVNEPGWSMRKMDTSVSLLVLFS